MVIYKRLSNETLDPFIKFLKTSSGSSVIMIFAMIAAIYFANSGYADWYNGLWQTRFGFTVGEFTLYKPVIYWINDGLMALFFVVAGLEIKREILVGELSTPSKALLPIMGAIGGAVVPALFYTAFNYGGNISGWGVPMATDIAFALGILSLVGDRVPAQLKMFLLSLAVVDDMIAVLIIAIFYTDTIQVTYLVYAIISLITLFAMNRLKINQIFYYLIVGAFLWYFFLKSGIHATIAGVLLAFFIPSRPTIPLKTFSRMAKKSIADFEQCIDDPSTDVLTKCQKKHMNTLIFRSHAAYNPMSRLEDNLHGFTAYIIMPIFAFANMGISLSMNDLSGITDPVSIGIMSGLLLGKPIGVMSTLLIAKKYKIAEIPVGISMKDFFGVSLLSGIGLTMSIFISTMAFSPEVLQVSKLAILISSVIAGAAGFIYLKKRFY